MRDLAEGNLLAWRTELRRVFPPAFKIEMSGVMFCIACGAAGN